MADPRDGFIIEAGRLWDENARLRALVAIKDAALEAARKAWVKLESGGYVTHRSNCHFRCEYPRLIPWECGYVAACAAVEKALEAK